MNIFIIRFKYDGERRMRIALIAAEDQAYAQEKLAGSVDKPYQIASIHRTTSDQILDHRAVIIP